MRLWPRTIRARLTFWYALGLGLPLVAFAVALYLLFSQTLRERTDAFIGDALGVFSRELVSERRTRPTVDEAIAATIREVRFQHLDVVVIDDSGRTVGMSAPTDDPRDASSAIDSATIIASLRATTGGSATTISQERTRHRLLVHEVPVGDRRYRVGGIYPMHDVEATLERIRGIFVVAIPLLVLAASIGGWFLARQSLAPVSAMASRAAEIGATTLHERLPIAEADELGRLARVLNDLLDRLERAFAQQRRFMADASHELRTPAAIVRTEAEVTLSRPARSEGEYRESMGVVQDAARRLTRIVEDIFLLARADAGHLVLNRAPIDLEDLVHDIVRGMRPLADAKQVQLEFSEIVEAPVAADGDLIGRVLLNLLDNAIKHVAPGGTVAVRMRKPAGAVEVAVIDDGPGIPAELHERVFERFFRADSARARGESPTTSGAGLGLAISQRIAELHGGTLRLVESRPGRTELRMRLPA